ncbi:hypothetical protein MTBBW1_600027 [Desulfamplus magnetovallimortis]|uniref:Uncharacterized protein n=1 Tax=Desulfamplus magnetovallimortis TaxID=1246637 RepID=A0A1W1HI65_9BACT|nr:hypothetical protein MTBBW1_600027 [Desulfamplus magnetovallimortis]
MNLQIQFFQSIKARIINTKPTDMGLFTIPSSIMYNQKIDGDSCDAVTPKDENLYPFPNKRSWSTFSHPRIWKFVSIFGMLHFPVYTFLRESSEWWGSLTKKCKVLLGSYEGCPIFTVNGHDCHPATPEYGNLYPFPR